MGNCLCSRRQVVYLTIGPGPQPNRRQMLPRSGCVHCKSFEEDWTCPNLGICSCPQHELASPSCVFYSPRIQGLFEGERTELETTQEHWTQVNNGNDVEMERVGEENCNYFDEVLMKHPIWGNFFSKFEGLIVNDKIGEGGQVEIFGAEMKHGLYQNASNLVAKVCKKNVSLRDLERQWPLEFLSIGSSEEFSYWSPLGMILGGTFIRGGIHKNRFAFVMKRRMCDLRTLIDKRMLNMLHKRTHGPPFEDMVTVSRLLRGISGNMFELHEHGVVHRDIKASNVLVNAYEYFSFYCLMDFECALGTMGTGFWRAPEILEQVQRRVRSHEVVFTKKADIYAFGMLCYEIITGCIPFDAFGKLCYEIITGCIPFDGHRQNDYGVVLGGGRPELLHNLDLNLKELILDCWKQDLSKDLRQEKSIHP